MVFIKLNSNNSINLVRQIQLSFEISVHIKDIELLYKLKSFFGEAGTISIPSTRKDARLKITGLNDIFNFIIPHIKQYPLHGLLPLRCLLPPLLLLPLRCFSKKQRVRWATFAFAFCLC